MAATLTATPRPLRTFLTPLTDVLMPAQLREMLLCIPRMDLAALLACVVNAEKLAPPRTIMFLITAIAQSSVPPKWRLSACTCRNSCSSLIFFRWPVDGNMRSKLGACLESTIARIAPARL